MAVGGRRPRGWSLMAGAVVCLTLILYCVARYGDSVLGFLFLDDFWLAHDAYLADRGGDGALAIFRPSLYGGIRLYRPFTQLGYFYLLRLLFGVDSGGYHAFQLAVFALNSALVATITQALTRSWLWAAVAGLLYASAPGHAVAVYWLAAFTMTGTATAVFATVLWWLHTEGLLRVIGTAVLQTIALLCSEHAVTVPVLLAVIAAFGPRRESARAALRRLAPALLITAIYLAVKLVLLAGAGPAPSAYEMRLAPAEWLTNLGRFAVACVNMLVLADLSPAALRAVGAGIVVAAAVAAVLAARGWTACRLPALGLLIFLVGLAPVLPLINHYYDYFVGIAALGMVLAVVGVCRMVPMAGPLLGAAAVAAVFIVDVRTCDAAAQQNPVQRLFIESSVAATRLLMDLGNTAPPDPSEAVIAVPYSMITEYAIRLGHAQEMFFSAPLQVWLASSPADATRLGLPPPPPGARLLNIEPAPDDVLPFWWSADLDGVRSRVVELYRWRSALCR